MKRWLLLIACLVLSIRSGVDVAAQETTPAESITILAATNFWRVRTVWETEEVLTPAGTVGHVRFKTPGAYEFFRQNPEKNEVQSFSVEDVPVVRLPADTPAAWMKPEFDDSTWARLRGPFLAGSTSDNWKLILLRARFEVRNPGRATNLKLGLKFRGGVVVYLNGEEIARAYMPRGPLDLYTPAEPYPRDAYLTADGFLYARKERGGDLTERQALRVRCVENITIPTAKLRPGVNVLAVSVHRAPTDSCFFLRRHKSSFQCNPPHDDLRWAKIGLLDLELVGPTDLAITASSTVTGSRSAVQKKLRVWNQSIIQTVFLSDYPDPFSPLAPVNLTGVRNGIFAGQIVVGAPEPIVGLKVEVSDLRGPATIPASAVNIRYAVPDGARGEGVRGSWFDSLEEAPPEEIPAYPEHGGAVQPIWLTVAVPRNAAPGEYTANLQISAKGTEPLSVPLRLRVIDWTLPEFGKFTVGMDLVQSPETVALAYEVPLWSDQHFKLLDKTFSLMRPLAAKTLYITAIRRTHFGNEHAQVRWIRDENGDLSPDFSIVEKYLDVAVKHLGRIPGVILYCWEPPESQGHAGGAGGASRTYDKPILISVLDLKTGEVSARQGPAWGTPEAVEFWKKLTDNFRVVLRKRGLEGSLLFGLVGDARPTKLAMDNISAGIGPDAKWAIHSHYYCHNWQGYAMGLIVALWGVGCAPVDPSAGYCYGWSNPLWLMYYPREMMLQSTLVEHRTKLELSL
ncbi:MAG: DUF6067 family protein, partial [Kiritimatiellae bacterium]|nr:DUF6067 family protein [Kiritimatiellia bacterium]